MDLRRNARLALVVTIVLSVIALIGVLILVILHLDARGPEVSVAFGVRTLNLTSFLGLLLLALTLGGIVLAAHYLSSRYAEGIRLPFLVAPVNFLLMLLDATGLLVMMALGDLGVLIYPVFLLFGLHLNTYPTGPRDSLIQFVGTLAPLAVFYFYEGRAFDLRVLFDNLFRAGYLLLPTLVGGGFLMFLHYHLRFLRPQKGFVKRWSVGFMIGYCVLLMVPSGLGLVRSFHWFLGPTEGGSGMALPIFVAVVSIGYRIWSCGSALFRWVEDSFAHRSPR